MASLNIDDQSLQSIQDIVNALDRGQRTRQMATGQYQRVFASLEKLEKKEKLSSHGVNIRCWTETR